MVIKLTILEQCGSSNDHFIIDVMKQVVSTLVNLKINLKKPFLYNCETLKKLI